jgi:hypothetical protein
MLRLLRPLVHSRRSLFRRAYAVASNGSPPVANALQNIEREHERLLRVVERRIHERKALYSQANTHFPHIFNFRSWTFHS